MGAILNSIRFLTAGAKCKEKESRCRARDDKPVKPVLRNRTVPSNQRKERALSIEKVNFNARYRDL